MNINVFLIRLLQFITFAVFLFAALVYAGAFLLVPLDIIFQVTRLLHGIGLPTIMALLVAGGAVWYVGKRLWEMPALWHLVWDVGMQIVSFGQAQVKRYDEVLADYRNTAAAKPE